MGGRHRLVKGFYIWDKQAAARFGRPPLLRMRDCDVGTPAPVDDELITPAGVGAQPPGTASRMAAFVCLCHLAAVLDAVLDTPPSHAASDKPGSFLARATAVIAGTKQKGELRAEEVLLATAVAVIPPHWAHTLATLAPGRPRHAGGAPPLLRALRAPAHRAPPLRRVRGRARRGSRGRAAHRAEARCNPRCACERGAHRRRSPQHRDARAHDVLCVQGPCDERAGLTLRCRQDPGRAPAQADEAQPRRDLPRVPG
jgi:hypothetical protein